MTVDMIATGTDVKPLECVFFMRAVKSRTYFEQMKGRGVRVIDRRRLPGGRRPTPTAKDRFVIVDAVGVTESELVDTRRRSTASRRWRSRGCCGRSPIGVRDAGRRSRRSPSRLARLDRRLSPTTQRAELEALAGGADAPRDRRRHGRRARPRPPARRRAARRRGTEEPVRWTRSPTRRAHAPRRSSRAARARAPSCASGSSSSAARHEQAIDEISADEGARGRLLEGGRRPRALDRRVLGAVLSRSNRDEITALQVLYSRRTPSG